MTLRIANAAGFWGDDLDAPRRLVAAAQVDFLTLEYLAELTMSILAHQRSKNPEAGFATDFISVLDDLIPALQQTGLRVVTNAGGVHPRACAVAAGRKLTAAGSGEVSIAVVSGDDLLPRLDAIRQAGWTFRHFDTGEPLSAYTQIPVSANAYLGAEAIAESISGGARLTITGRVADASLTVGPAAARFGWSWTDWDRLAAATVAGHLIECGAQVTGGYSTAIPPNQLVDVGYPIAEIAATGETTITKPDGSGGMVNRQTVVEQLVYEIGDPSAYYTPDVVADFTAVEVAELAPDRVRVRGTVGKPASDTYKVSLAYPAGFMASAWLLVRGRDAVAKAKATGELVLARLRRQGIVVDRHLLECLGSGSPTTKAKDPGCQETVLRLTVHDPRRAAVEKFTREIAPLITSGPSGLAGYASGKPTVRPVLAYFPTLVPKDLVTPMVEVRTASQWAACNLSQTAQS